MWGLAAYGADGVQGVVEMLQTELARYMGMCGKSTLKMLDRTLLRVHGVPAARTIERRSDGEPARMSRPWVAVRREDRRAWRQSVSRRKAIAELAGALAGRRCCRPAWRRRRIRAR